MRFGSPLLLTVILGLSGCAGQSLRTRFSNEFGCPVADVTMQGIGANGYRLRGCGRSVIYVCARGPQNNSAVCVADREEQIPEPVAAEGFVARPTPSARAQHAQGNVRGSPAVLFSFDHVFDLDLLYTPGTDPERVVARARAPAGHDDAVCSGVELRGSDGASASWTFDGSASSGAAADDVLAIAAADGLMLSLCGQTTALSQGERRQFLRFQEGIREHRSLGAPPARRPGPVPEAPSPATAAVRAWLDSERDVILGCAGAALAVVEVQPNGALTVRDVATAEQDCVRAALGAPATLPEEVVVHVVRRPP